MDPDLRQTWDVLVVGTGVGGATLGHALVAAGRRVLFCELGGADAEPLRGAYPELADGRRGEVLGPADAALLLRAGRWAEPLIDEGPARARRFVPYVGCGSGGSSALYGMALERFGAADFQPEHALRADPHCDAVEHWPITAAELAPYYDQAEALYGVRGGRDPLATAAPPTLPGAAPTPPAPPPPCSPPLPAPPPISPAGADLMAWLAARGLHPYRLPLACGHSPGCATCQGLLCPQRGCKRDAAQVALYPALAPALAPAPALTSPAPHAADPRSPAARGHARLLTGCRVLEVLSQGRRASGVRCRLSDDSEHTLHARVVVLAAGALQTPLLLLRSRDATGHPGLANASGLVGRCLMRHLIDLYLVRPQPAAGRGYDNRGKEVGCNDFQFVDGRRLGTLQSFGRLPPAAMLYGALRDDLRASRWGRVVAAGLPLARPLLQRVLHDLAERWTALATIAEDLPYADHGIVPGGLANPAAAGVNILDTPRLRYRLHPEAQARVALLRRQMQAVLRGRRWRLLPQADNNQRIAHACGTCRFGTDPRRSVLDRDNRAHDVENLYIVDASFFPSAGATNPALTIAANALRVAARIAAALP
jgi:choline dehydrogenase-like flavoprotein